MDCQAHRLHSDDKLRLFKVHIGTDMENSRRQLFEDKVSGTWASWIHNRSNIFEFWTYWV